MLGMVAGCRNMGVDATLFTGKPSWKPLIPVCKCGNRAGNQEDVDLAHLQWNVRPYQGLINAPMGGHTKEKPRKSRAFIHITGGASQLESSVRLLHPVGSVPT